MGTYHVTIVNEHFSSSNEHRCDNVADAWKHAIKGALDIASEQVSHVDPYFGAEIVLDEGEKRVGRYVISVGVSPLKD